jgi:hypothetical protein
MMPNPNPNPSPTLHPPPNPGPNVPIDPPASHSVGSSGWRLPTHERLLQYSHWSDLEQLPDLPENYRNATSAPPADFLNALRADKKAAAFYKTLNRANTYAIEWRIHDAKRPETRAKRIADLVAMLAAGKKLH